MMFRIVALACCVTFTAALPANEDSWEEVATPKAENVILDAGSGGTKIFAYVDGQTWDNANLDSVCDPKTLPNKGLAMLPYPPGTTAGKCHSRFQLWAPRGDIGNAKMDPAHILPTMTGKMKTAGVAGTGNAHGSEVSQERCSAGTPAACVRTFRTFLLKGVASYYSTVHPGQTENGGEAKNKGAVPAVATAGMRTLDQDENDVVWDNVCGKSDNKVGNYNLAPKGDQCGTISGTTEAFYEYKGYVKKMGTHPPNHDDVEYKADRGTFTIGGASAQIAFPLKTAKQETSFKNLITEAAENIDCQAMVVASGKPAPKFGGGLKQLETLIGKKAGYTEDNKGCVVDYIDIKTEGSSKIATISFLNLAANPPQSGYQCDKKLKDVLHTCLHAKMEPADKKSASCLAAKARCSAPIAGGAQEMVNWASRHCTGSAEACTTSLKAALEEDGFWGAVTSWFKSTTLGVAHFAYATDNANQGLQEQAAGKAAGDLKAKATSACKDFADPKKFNWTTKKDDSKDCVEAIWAKMYLTAFFGGTTHPDTQAEMGPNSDWANGFPLSLVEMDDINTDVNFHYTDGFFHTLN
jgi:hypothetical protein